MNLTDFGFDPVHDEDSFDREHPPHGDFVHFGYVKHLTPGTYGFPSSKVSINTSRRRQACTPADIIYELYGLKAAVEFEKRYPDADDLNLCDLSSFLSPYKCGSEDFHLPSCDVLPQQEDGPYSTPEKRKAFFEELFGLSTNCESPAVGIFQPFVPVSKHQLRQESSWKIDINERRSRKFGIYRERRMASKTADFPDFNACLNRLFSLRVCYQFNRRQRREQERKEKRCQLHVPTCDMLLKTFSVFLIVALQEELKLMMVTWMMVRRAQHKRSSLNALKNEHYVAWFSRLCVPVC